MSISEPFRPDVERQRCVNGELREPERLRAHYEVERELATRLRSAPPEGRSSLYGDVYAELFARVPDHPQHKIDPAKRLRNTAAQVAFLRSFVQPSSVFVEVGCGDAAVTQAVAGFVTEAVGIDVTPALIDAAHTPPGFRFVRTNGTDLNLPTDYADVIYSNQLMEHLHPDDAVSQLQEIRRVLKPDACYVCSTPSRVTGPHDISAYFGYEPAGFHLREYDHASLAGLFHNAGFRSVKARFSIKGRKLTLPVGAVTWVEKLLLRLPQATRARLAQIGPVRNLAGVLLIGRK